MVNKRISRKEYQNKFLQSPKSKKGFWGYIIIGIDAILASFGIGEEGKD
ncbi:hypothetical protein [Lactobacillus mulieris]|uniref:Uncharacterized protein n=1 Tax=Lactobacillus mulieris TaxID=2508708 RepID=A0AAW5WXJ0_9LACO|nr:hypothetical protein [Lactobacillus mulieris]MCZ3622154.1 hypothetical protein [Lactobacillus mulieris]MCZ3623851.1 hypothetical protein [Lactobacillus mulieris]MCZ3636161.1 hypothetical protein [Lactobacillus mulieris]MCZ3690150.1 hypothetical protein [Lactobacillus mulieris]MCZ3696231.1 hypothetical protein [Lactobacillus mulieris]